LERARRERREARAEAVPYEVDAQGWLAGVQIVDKRAEAGVADDARAALHLEVRHLAKGLFGAIPDPARDGAS